VLPPLVTCGGLVVGVPERIADLRGRRPLVGRHLASHVPEVVEPEPGVPQDRPLLAGAILMLDHLDLPHAVLDDLLVAPEAERDAGPPPIDVNPPGLQWGRDSGLDPGPRLGAELDDAPTPLRLGAGHPNGVLGRHQMRGSAAEILTEPHPRRGQDERGISTAGRRWK